MSTTKKILLIIGITLAVLTVLIAIPLIMFSKNYKVPTDQYSQNEVLYMKQFDDEYRLLANDTTKTYIDTNLTEVFINQYIKNQLFKDNPKYLNELYKTDLEYKYMYLQEGSGMRAGIKGLYTKVKEEQIDVVLSVDLLSGKTRLYQTGVLLRLHIKQNEEDTYVIKVNRIVVGKTRLPLKNGIGLTNYIMKKINDKTLQEVIQGALPVGTFTQKDVTVRVSQEDMINYAQNTQQGLGTLMRLIYEHKLFKMSVEDKGIDISLGLGKLRRPLTDPNRPAFTPITDAAGQQAFMSGLNTRLLAGFMSNPANPHVDLNEAEANQMLDYALKDSVKFTKDIPIRISPTEVVTYSVESTNLFLTMLNDKLYLHLEFLIKRENSDVFRIQLNLSSTIAKNGDNLEITMIDAYVNDINLTKEQVMTIVDMYNPGMFVDGKLIITKEQMNEMFYGAEMTIKDVEVISGQLRLHYDYTPSP